MGKIEESENFHSRRKITSSLKMTAFLETLLFAKNTLSKSQEGTQNFRFIAAVVKTLLQFKPGYEPKTSLHRLG